MFTTFSNIFTNGGRNITKTELKPSFLKFLFQDNGHFRIFLQKGGLVNLPSGNGFFPLHLAAFKGDTELVSLLMDNMTPEDINHPGFGGCSALHVAVLMGHLPVVSVLASKGASLIVREKYFEIFLSKARYFFLHFI